MRWTWRLLGIVAAAFTLGALPTASTEASGEVPEVFAAEKCSLCHSVESIGIERRSKSEKMHGPDLSDVGSRHDAAWIEGWLRQDEEIEGKTHQRPFKGSDEDLRALVDWLCTLQGEETDGDSP